MSDESTPQPVTPSVTILAKNNGPFLVDGPFRLVDADGNEYDVPAGKKVNLCRCGGSTRKPFCDGTHSRIGFEAAERAVRAADEGEATGQAPQGGQATAGGQAPQA
ncbi:CDGSH iron-sulfur domain-containing protein [Longimicrobium sp.]|uniref:CDGSH iron-sulfur domain-containing protein n=1 Tax=Longimicrobium sp. TaxID=2029185 RepID=UPI002E3461AC|nr:CDGSH iron-sulfur domain-containing protein [Longimicrobium sp.]HEX6039754.1 CDGSH iron-sulfur domain-containing protein [Longimicrobium sp.]